MSDNKRYYYLKIKETFFDGEEMKILESQQNGIIYQNLYLKMCLLSVKSGGALLFKDAIPYDVNMLSSVLRVNIDTVKTGIEMFSRLGLVEILDSGVIYILDIQSLIGQSSSEGERKKIYRAKIKRIKKIASGQSSGQSSALVPQKTGHRTLELELNTDTKKEPKKYKEEPVFSKAEALNPNKKNSEQRFQQLKTAWNANCKPSCTIRGTDTMNYYQREDWIAGESQIVDIFATCKAMQNYGGVQSNPEYEIDNHSGYSMLSFLVKGVEWYTDEAKPFERCRKKQAGPHVQTDEERRALIAKAFEEVERERARDGR